MSKNTAPLPDWELALSSAAHAKSEAQPEINMLDVLRQSREVYFVLPSDPAQARLGVALADKLAQEHVIKAALRTMLNDMKFETEAAERGTMPAANTPHHH